MVSQEENELKPLDTKEYLNIRARAVFGPIITEIFAVFSPLLALGYLLLLRIENSFIVVFNQEEFLLIAAIIFYNNYWRALDEFVFLRFIAKDIHRLPEFRPYKSLIPLLVCLCLMVYPIYKVLTAFALKHGFYDSSEFIFKYKAPFIFVVFLISLAYSIYSKRGLQREIKRSIQGLVSSN